MAVASSSSSSSAVEWKFDVFLSFRGPDTRKGITTNLYHRLQKRGIKTFMDDRDLQAGDSISPALLKAIEESRFAIIVLSASYSHSTWCLKELTKICDCMDVNRILPLFYDVDPSVVRHRKRSFKEAFDKHEKSQRSEELQRWRDALRKVADISGWDRKNFKTDEELIDKIVDFMCSKVQPTGIEFTLSTGDFGAYEATRKAMDEVMQALTDDEVTTVGVYGMGGVGKTTMVKHVGEHAKKNGMFHHVIMGVVSQSPDFVKLQGTMADMLGVKLERETGDGRAASLHEEIMKREKLLIILDDVWRRTELSKIGIPSYKDLQMRKSKVLFTTRIKHVCDRMDCQRKITLGTLSGDDSWTLFERNAGISFESKKLKDVAKKVAGECRGLPIALIAVARALGDKDEAEWHKAARRLEKSQSATVEDEQEAFKCIRLSYDYLKSKDCKACFLLCCLYPEDQDIRIEDLIKYAIGTGLFRDGGMETIEEARETADSVVKYLLDSNLLLEGEENGCVKMHDVIRDAALNIAKSESEDGHRFLLKAGCGLEDWPSEIHEDCNAISLMRNKIHKLPEEELACPHLQILLLNRNDSLRGIPEKFIQSLTQLRLLDLSRTRISLLPGSFSFLTNLQALYLDDCLENIDISIVGKLKKLEILSMRDCAVEKLGEVRHLTNLRILDVSRSSFEYRTELIIPSGVISKLQKLEELYMLYCGLEDWGSKFFESEGEEETEDPESKTEGEGEEAEDWETNVQSVQEETELSFAGLSKLKILHVCISNAKCIPKILQVKPDWDYFYICVGDFIGYGDNHGIDHHSRSLSLLTTMSTLPDWFVNAVAPKTEQLEYELWKGMNVDIVEEYDYGRLYEVKLLRISYSNLEELINTTRRVQEGPVFEKLEELHLLNLYDLKELCVGELPPGSLCNLKILHMKDCIKLKNVSKLVQRLPDLEILYLISCHELENVFESGGLEPERLEPREMHLLGPNSVKSICSGHPPRVMLQSLKSVTFYRCYVLQSLFTSDVAECLVQLEDLFVEECHLLERVIKEVKNEKTVLPKLKNLVLNDLPKLYGESGSADIECPSLENLNVVECFQFPFSITKNDLLWKSQKFPFSFSTSASDYFGSTNPVKLNDLQLYDTFTVWPERQPEVIVESASSTVRPIEAECTMSTGDFQAFEATRLAMDKVMKALEDDKVTTVGVYGVGGVGKTALVKHVGAEVQNSGLFNHVITIAVSRSPDLRKIQCTLADSLGFILEEETEIGRSLRLMQMIRRGNRILIILDDIWERINFSNIGIPSHHELQRCNSKVLLTTRTKNVCHAMECQSEVLLDVLTKEDSWTLLVNRGRRFLELAAFFDVARKVAKECAGLPLALIAVAKALCGKCLDDWKKAARQLKSSHAANPEDGRVVFNCIKFSYDCLRSGDAKSCFLLCCLFPEDYDIQIEDLLKCGMGVGLFQDFKTMQDARARAHSVVKYLRDCSLLLETEQEGCVKMHDVIRDTAIRISSSEDGSLFFVKAGCQLQKWPSIGAHEGYSAISLIRNKICKLPEELVCPKLLILLLQSNVWLDEIPEYFFQNLNGLRVLDLSRTRISLLPTSFGILINLQTLYLDGCVSPIGNISILGKLGKLEILSMRELPLAELPKEIGELSHLRMLDITGDYVDNVPSEVICKLNVLEELYMQCNFADWGSSKVEGAGEENIVAFDELICLSRLEVLKVFVSDTKCLPRDLEVEPNWVSFDICICRDPSIRNASTLVSSSSPTSIRALTLDTTINALPGWFINVLTMKAEKLQYMMCWGLDNILVEFDCGRLHALKYLSVVGPSENLKVLMTPFRKEPVFQNLEELHLVQVDCLKVLCVGELPVGSLCNLRLLKVKHCYELVDALLPSQLLNRLQNLEKLICEEIDELEYVFGCEGLEPKQIIMTQLIEMRLENLGNLLKIWNGSAPSAMFQNLQILVVSGCCEVKNLFTADVAQCLLHLEDLSVELCPMLGNVIEASEDTMDNNIVFPELKNLALIRLPQLTKFCGSTGSGVECPLLEYLCVERCPLFSTPNFHSRNNVQVAQSR